MKQAAFLLMFILCTHSNALADILSVGSFSTTGLTGWSEKSFKGATEYKPIREDGRTVIKSHSSNSASGLIKQINIDPIRYRYLRWSWKIGSTVKHGDEEKKSGDDYAARIYVVFPGRFFWQTKAINYIWSNRLPKGSHRPNAFSANVMMVAVESGPELAGTWLTEKRDVADDYRRLFGGEPGAIQAIAIMTDTDNTGGEADAWYGDITMATE